ncbi:MAG: conjugative transposon protein TraM [Sediminibacterium sp.]
MKAIKFENRKIKFALFVAGVGTVFVAIMWLIFYNGKSDDSKAIKNGGLNMVLPGANLKNDSTKDKLSFYAAAALDSLKRMEQVRMDPNRQDSISKPASNVRGGLQIHEPRLSHSEAGNSSIEARMKTIRQQLSKQTVVDYSPSENDISVTRNATRKTGGESVPDPEMEAINSTLDKLMAIQHPEKNIPSTNVVKQPGYPVSIGEENDATYFGKKGEGKKEIFYNDGASHELPISELMATIASNQELQNGSVLRMELMSAIWIGVVNVPVGTAIFGIASIDAERLRIHIPSIRFQNKILPVSLDVYDMDGLEGIYAPGSIGRDVAKESADGAIQSTGIAGFGLSLKTQAAAAGIGAAKSLLSKKVKQVRVTVSAGYRVLLRDNKQIGN